MKLPLISGRLIGGHLKAERRDAANLWQISSRLSSVSTMMTTETPDNCLPGVSGFQLVPTIG
ncbi:MAG: hypothetical protein AAFX04_07165 [Pseudomonadota bacterium]